jgi:ribose transport system permease protein
LTISSATPVRQRLPLTQERIVLLVSLLLFLGFSAGLNGFLSVDNLLSLVRTVSILGILGLGMAVAVIARGIDLSMVAVMVVTSGWAFTMINEGTSAGMALALAFVVAALIGVLNGILAAYVEIPALFTTLAVGVLVAGAGQFFVLEQETVTLPGSLGWLGYAGRESVVSVPTPVIVFLVVALVVALLLRRTVIGHYLYNIGDNPGAARITGVPVRPMIVTFYAITALIAATAGIVSALSIGSVGTRVINGTLLYDVILVVVLGGIGLSGGKGSARNVLVGTLLIGLLINGMTLLNLQITTQNLMKACVLLIAIVADGLLNPRDEQTAQAGDI